MYKRIIIILYFLAFFFVNPLFTLHAQESGSFRFIVLGCMHMDLLNPQDYELIAGEIKQYHPDFVLFHSDTGELPGESTVKFSGQGFRRAMNRSGIPVYDTMNKFLPIASASIVGEIITPEDARSYFEHKNNLFICPGKGNASRKTNGQEMEDEIGRLKRIINDASSRNNVFIFTHQLPWFDEGAEWSKAGLFFIKNNVKGIFGPNLGLLEFENKGGNYVISRNLPCYLRRDPQQPLVHFIVVDVERNKAVPRFVTIKNKVNIHNVSFKAKETLPREYGPSRKEAEVEYLFLTDSKRDDILYPRRVIEALRIKPGMNILDIGAGVGLFTMPFSQELKGTGMVFATEIDSQMLAHIRKRMEETQYKNISAVLVSAEGLDPFYKQHVFDIIFLCEAYHCLSHHEDYFRELLPSLEKRNGRLYIIEPEDSRNFSEIDFDDFSKIVKSLASYDKGCPLFKRLSKETGNFIQNWHGEDITAGMKTKIIQDINNMLSDRWLLNDLMDYYAREEMIIREDAPMALVQFREFPYNLKYYKWKVAALDASGVFSPEKKDLDYIHKAKLFSINQTLLMMALGITMHSNLHDLQNAGITSSRRDSIVSTMEAAGYEFVREYNFLPARHFLEFKRKL